LNIIYGKKIRFPNTLVEKLLFFFSIYLLISTFYVSTDRAYGIVKLKMYVYSLIIFYIPVIYTETKKDIYKFLKSIFFFGIVLLALGLSQKLGISNPFIADYGVRFNIVGFNPIWVGRYLSYGMLIGILFITNYAKNFISNIGKILVLIVVISLQLYLLLLTGSRGPLVGFLLAGFYIILRKGNVNILKIAFYVAISAILLYVIYSLLPIAISERIINTNVSGVVTTYIRFGAFWEAIRGFLSSAFFGIGFGSYKFGGGFIQLLIYPHNVYLEVLSETGLIGAIIFVGFNLYILVQYQLLSKKIDYNLSTIIVALFIASFINSNLSGHIGANNYLWLSLGIMYSVKKIDFFEEKQLNKETTS
jgi:O-antigen ligase